jgi:transketolase C-terminal domain/subunit
MEFHERYPMKNIKRGIAAAALVGLSGGLLLAAPAHAATTTIEVWMDD